MRTAFCISVQNKVSETRHSTEGSGEKDKKDFIIMNFIFIYYANIFRKETLHPVFVVHFTSKFSYTVFTLNLFFKSTGTTILQILKIVVFLFLVSNDFKFLGSVLFCYGDALTRRKWVAFPKTVKIYDVFLINSIVVDWCPPSESFIQTYPFKLLQQKN